MAPRFEFTEVRVEDSPKRIRVFFGGQFVVDTRKAKLVWEAGSYYPWYYFPQSEVAKEYIQLASEHPDGDSYDLVAGSKKAPGAVTSVLQARTMKHRTGLVKIKFSDADAWFEEEEQIFIHPKDPYKRVDVLSSTRHIRVEVEGVEVANTRAPKLLFETNLHVRSYIPKTDCRLDLLVPSDLKTGCPYKGEANYYHVQVSPEKRVDNVVWWYRNPNLECAAINNPVDVFVDGVKQPRPQSPWSK
ncbi:hypothetical protein C8F04DRAFT_1113375 [Mycena alexandri]|uniref:DUF427 domain-containing protein n=1 Tax=Mycena alexandri TaxID=1745969 RepID=A0AAD6WWT7_9AGAR|nr:hypothetical protein C8F04DRAFT_1113375 [Mycena alexandri]